jgi:predicted esterase
LVTAHTIAAQVQGRYLVDVPEDDGPFPVLAGFHGYAERAEHMLDALRRIRADRRWVLVSIQALNRFYRRDNNTVVANWMTREDREQAIADNVAYVQSVMAAVLKRQRTNGTVVYAGFSQGVAMAYRAVAFAGRDGGAIPAARGGIMLAGDVPPDVAPRLASFPPILIGRGRDDQWYTEAKESADLAAFSAAGVSPATHVFDGGHSWEAPFIAAAQSFLDSIAHSMND